MLIEASTPLTIRRRSGDVRLHPGQPVDFPEDEALKLLAKAHGKVREVKTDWLAAWRELAALTSGLAADDPRIPLVMDALNLCDDAYLGGNWVAFRHAVARVRSAMVRLAKEALRQQKALDPIPTIQPGDRIEWQRAGTAQQGLVDFLHCDADGTMWAFCTVPDGSWTAVNCKFVRTVQA